ncbi:formate dehydrogenase subunit gamma [Geotalea toluenoxydans]|uniref:formate dehydrogenase subunit gamma n=1 Tax=Geotalea toluenoxydans TaxID=421624 RepID=UPI0006D2C857|nr:formate dehydrogenase subunit gamma [Geotalea toluenoxydans]
MSNYIDRFNTKERVLHWFVTTTFFTLLLSGLGLYSRLFTGYFNLFGGGQKAITIHKIAGVLFFISSLVLFLHNRARTVDFNRDDLEWCRYLGGYLSREEIHLKVGKFNAGQKVFGVFIGLATLFLGITGIFIWWPLAFPRWIVQLSLLIHGLLFVLSAMFVVVHVYLGTIGNPGTLEAMLWGKVSRAWAKKHHPKWYKEVTGE